MTFRYRWKGWHGLVLAIFALCLVDLLVWRHVYAAQLAAGESAAWAHIDANMAISLVNLAVAAMTMIGNVIFLEVHLWHWRRR